MKSDIIPAILEGSLAAIGDRLAQVKLVARSVQIDVVDGVYAPARTWPYANRAQQEEFERLSAQEEGLPLWDSFDFEFDLMIADAASTIPQWVAAGASRVVIHADAQGARAALDVLQPYREGSFPVAVGVALGSSAAAGDMEPYLPLCDFVQVMGIAQVGAQGSAFDTCAISLVGAIHSRYPDMQIQVDGGVREENMHPLIEAGATRLIVGSAIFGSAHPRTAFLSLQKSAVY